MDSLDKKQEYFMKLAIRMAEEGARAGEVPVGAVIVGPDNEILALAHNEPIRLYDPTAHAEILAMRKAARRIGNYRLTGCSLFVTLEPCVMCYGAMIHARIKSLFFGAFDPKAGAETVFKLFSSNSFNHKIEIQGGLLSDICGKIMKEFFERARAKPNPSLSQQR
jgi:tRNA(adenine34) deaminase